MISLGHAVGSALRPARSERYLTATLWTLLPLVIAGLIGLAGRASLQTVDQAMLLLLAVVVTAARSGPLLASVTALLAIAVFDLLFVLPYYTLHVADPSFLLTMVVMFAVAIAVSLLTGRLREEMIARRHRAQVSELVLSLTDAVSVSDNPTQTAQIAAATIATALGRDTWVLLDPHGLTPDLITEQIPTEVMAHGLREAFLPVLAGHRPHALSVDGWTVQSAGSGTPPPGVVIVAPPAEGDDTLLPEDLLDALTERLGIVVERQNWRREAEEAQGEITAAHLRTTLLSSVSHDLRTPLAAIDGAAETLLLPSSAKMQPQEREGLLQTIRAEAERMNRLIGNLLASVRLAGGVAPVHATWQPIEEVLGSARQRMGERLAHHSLHTEIPRSLPLVFIDELMIEQVLLNLFDNIVRYTPVNTSIDVQVTTNEASLTLALSDRGPGIRADVIQRAFSPLPFPRDTTHGRGEGGLGLGLSICRGIMTAHAGSFAIHSRDGGGTTFLLTLPLGVPPLPPPLLSEADE